MKDATDFAKDIGGGRWEAVAMAIKSRDCEIRASELRTMATFFQSLIRHSRDGYIQLTSVAEALNEQADRAERGES